MKEKTKQLKTVQEEWMGATSEKEKREDVIVVKEFACDFD